MFPFILMLARRTFLTGLLLAPLTRALAGFAGRLIDYPKADFAAFSRHLRPVGRVLELPDSYVWCNSPIYGPDGKVHVSFSRWDAKKGMSGWINGSEIGRAVADRLEGPYVKFVGNLVIDFSQQGNNKQFEDAFVWRQRGKFRMLARDMGVYSQEVGLYLESADGKAWTFPKIAFRPLRDYGVQEPPAPARPAHSTCQFASQVVPHK